MPIPLYPLGRVIRKLQLTVMWAPKTLTLSCVNKSGTAHGLMQCPDQGRLLHTNTAVQFWMLRRALQFQRKGHKSFPPQFWKQLYLTAISEGTDLRIAAKAVDSEHKSSPDMTKCSLPHLSSYVAKLPTPAGNPELRPTTPFVLGLIHHTASLTLVKTDKSG